MRNLEKEIADWRRSMATTSGCCQELLDELEEHLREEIAQLLRSGISDDDVWQMAVARLGAPADLRAEFEKLKASRRAWMPVKIARLLVAATGAMSLAAALLFGERSGILLAIHVFCVSLGYSMMFVMGGLSIVYICAHWLGEPALNRRSSFLRATFQFAGISAVLVAVGTILGMFWAKDHLGRYWAWDLKETGAFWILGCALLISVLRWIKPAQTFAMYIAIAGNMITAWGWFGANAPASWKLSNPFLVVFVASQLIFILGGAVKGVADMKGKQAER